MFDSGVLTVWRGTDTSNVGEMPSMSYVADGRYSYEARTVGVNRYYVAQEHGDRCDLVARIPRTYGISAAESRVTIEPYTHQETGSYRITQIQQVIDDDGLPCTDLSLERDDGTDALILTEVTGDA